MRSLHYAWIILIMGVIVVFGALGLARFGYSAILPFMQASLNLNNTEAGALVTANLLGYVLLSLIGGALAARYGPRVVISLGLVFAGIGMLFTGAANGFLWAMFWRAVTGVGSGASNVPVMGMLSGWFNTKRRGFAAGVVAGGSSIGLIVAGPLVPYILTLYGSEGWRLGWYLFGGATLIFALISFLILRNRPSEMGLTPNGDAASAVVAAGGAPSGSMEWGRVYRSAAVWHLGLVYIAFGFSYIIYMT
ncbi:MAG: MFS transporter [Chloroflexi bacterium]|nr:MFS transporter [Chloroflexota bacterium]